MAATWMIQLRKVHNSRRPLAEGTKTPQGNGWIKWLYGNRHEIGKAMLAESLPRVQAAMRIECNLQDYAWRVLSADGEVLWQTA